MPARETNGKAESRNKGDSDAMTPRRTDARRAERSAGKRTGARKSGRVSPKRSTVNRPASGAMPAWLVAFAFVLLAAGFCLQNYVLATDDTTVIATAPKTVSISEVMTSNKSAVTDDKGNYSDWVELVNDTSSPVDITGWKLVDDQDKLLGFTFPGQVLEPGERVIVYCSGDLRTVAGYAYHAPFRLSAQGDGFTLMNAEGAVVDSVAIPALSGNEVYARDEDTGEWTIGLNYTPGLPNTQENHSLATGESLATGSLIINEVMSDNQTYVRCADGNYCDYIELYNASNAPVSLSGYTLTDDESKPQKWSFGDGATIGAGEYLIVYASGTADDAAGEIHASFKISSAGEAVRLYDRNGALLDSVNVPALSGDESYSRAADGSFTSEIPPTPGYSNDQTGINAVAARTDAQNPLGVYINEAIASARKPNSNDSAYDWIELYNSTGASVDLSGYHLTDDTSSPGKWTFPEGSSINSGEYLVIYASGEDRANASRGSYHTNFKLSIDENETIGLFSPEGELVDRLPMINQTASVSYGRPAGASGRYYLATPTRGAANESEYYQGQADGVEFARQGGYFTSGSVTVEMSSSPAATIRYTLDCSEPTEESPVYTSPFTVSQTTIVRARAYEDDMLPSRVATASYIFGEGHSLQVVSLVSQNDYLFGSDIGIYSVGPNELKYPFRGANFFKNWERAGNVELFSTDGQVVLSQGVGLQLQGQYSRMQDQKAFKVIARSTYDEDSTFDASLFPNREYTSYKSFILRASGQDGERTRIRDAVLTSLCEGTGVMYQDSVPVVVYINGEYWGHYNMRERIHKYSIAQWEGWTDVDAIDIVKGNSGVLQGTNDDYAQFLTWLSKNGCRSEENLARVEEMVDIDNYLTYVAIEMYIGNTDLLNVKRYRSSEGDGRWRWIIYDTDWAFNTDTDSFRRWLNANGVGSGNKTDNTLFVQLMKNPTMRDKFLRILANIMYNNFRPEIVIAKIDEYCQLIEDEMPAQTAKWGGSVRNWNSRVKQLKTYANSRPKKLLGYIRSELGWTTAQMREYFSEIMDAIGV
ncbi:MAG: lamin tail domain-containing protein [Clostridia bacterium]|nr:lamin tail domain-containing protein [Clostridia bacterium]